MTDVSQMADAERKVVWMDAKTYCLGCIHKEICGLYPQEGCDRFVFVDDVAEVPKWIPVTERLPEKDGMFLVSISPSSRMEKRVDTDFYSHFGVWQIFGEFVTAWCELPEPYGKETEDGRDTE